MLGHVRAILGSFSSDPRNLLKLHRASVAPPACASQRFPGMGSVGNWAAAAARLLSCAMAFSSTRSAALGLGWMLLSAGILGCQNEPERLEDGGTAQDAGTQCRAQIPKSQTLSQSCCPEWGADACGAMLFCAAFDGRTQPTCYAERSRADQATCTDDPQCQSGSCNPTVGKCRSLGLTTCSPTVGCAADPFGNRYGCDPVGLTCRKFGDGGYDSFCLETNDCAIGACQNNSCTCVAHCSGKQCGDNGCSGSCGTCEAKASCSPSGQCVCAGRACVTGDDCCATYSCSAGSCTK